MGRRIARGEAALSRQLSANAGSQPRQFTDGPRILPAYLSDNYFSLLPGETRTIEIQYPARAGRGVGQTGDQRLELVHYRDPDFESLERIAFQPTVVEKLLVGLAHGLDFRSAPSHCACLCCSSGVVCLLSPPIRL